MECVNSATKDIADETETETDRERDARRSERKKNGEVERVTEGRTYRQTENEKKRRRRKGWGREGRGGRHKGVEVL